MASLVVKIGVISYLARWCRFSYVTVGVVSSVLAFGVVSYNIR